MSSIKILRYIQELNCFVPTDEYKLIANHIGLKEWHEVVWIGRLFALDNDYGEHWFDNWELREIIEKDAVKYGLDSDNLLIIDPKRFMDGRDGPCHTDMERTNFWTDVLKSLTLSLDTLFSEARKSNEMNLRLFEEDYIEDLENRMDEIRKAYN